MIIGMEAQIFETSIIAKLKEDFQVGQQADGDFKYVELEVGQDEEGVIMSQN